MFNPFGGKKKKKGDAMEPMDSSYGGPMGPPGPARAPERRIVPTDEVRAYASRGVPEPDIIRTLRREGYSTNEIDQAMKDALRSRVSGDFYRQSNEYGERPLGGPPEDVPEREEIPRDLGYPTEAEDERGLPPLPEPDVREPEIPEMPEGGYFEPPQRRAPPSRSQQRQGIDKREIEELAEVIVDEKLRDIRERFKAVDSQFQQMTRKMDSVSDELNRIRLEKSNEVKGIESKIDGYSRNMDAINGRMESMEKALKDSLSPMLESMRSLAELVRSMKEKSK